MLNQSLLNDSSIVNDDVDFPVSGLEPLREEEEEEEEDFCQSMRMMMRTRERDTMSFESFSPFWGG